MNKLSEREFLQLLESKAEEERRVLDTEIMPQWARGVGEWLVVKPWRVMVPLSGITYYVLRITLGVELREFILGLFGGY